MTEPVEIFVSYKAEDRARLKPLVAALEFEGFSVWWDARIGGGSTWRQDIQDHLDNAKCVIVAWSTRSVGPDGDFVRDEATRARRRGCYLPILIDAVEPPLGFGEVQALSLTGWKGDRADPRFAALVEALRNRIGCETRTQASPHQSSTSVSRRALLVGGAGTAAVAVAGGWLILKPAPVNARRIAVLPFANLSGDPSQAYFSDGIAEELRGALSRIGLEVIGRSSSEAVKNLDTTMAASKLGVDHILTGSVRRSPELIRINAQLVRGSDGVERWARSYDRPPGDAIKIQSDIAASVAQVLSVSLGRAGEAALMLGGTNDSVAQDLFMRVMQLERESAYTKDELHQMLALTDAAIARDPQYANAHVARSHLLRSLNQIAEAEAAANQAVAIAPKLGWSYTALAQIDMWRGDLRGLLRNSKRALDLSPEHPTILATAATALSAAGDLDEARRLSELALALDPFYSKRYEIKGDVLFLLRRYSEAAEAYGRALELAPNRKYNHGGLGRTLTMMNRFVDAQAEYRNLPANDWSRLTGEALIAARMGDAVSAKRKMDQLRRLDGSYANYPQAEVFAQLQDTDRAFAELNAANEAKDGNLIWLKVDPFLDPIRSDPRYPALLRKLNFP